MLSIFRENALIPTEDNSMVSTTENKEISTRKTIVYNKGKITVTEGYELLTKLTRSTVDKIFKLHMNKIYEMQSTNVIKDYQHRNYELESFENLISNRNNNNTREIIIGMILQYHTIFDVRELTSI